MTPFPSRSRRLRIASLAALAPSVLGRPLSREGVRARQARGRARAWRRRLLALRRRRTRRRWRAGATSSWRCCRGTGAATRASMRPRRSTARRSCRSGAISTRAALENMAACLAFLAAEIGARGGRSAAGSGQRLRPLRRRLFRGRAGRGARAHRLLSLDLSRQRSRADRSAGPRASRQGASRSRASS